MRPIPLRGPPAYERPSRRSGITEDGRHAYPEVVYYEVSRGPDKGTVFTTPPQHGDCAPAEEDDCIHYFVRVRDLDAYRELQASGFLFSPEHWGASLVIEDYRLAPGA